MKKVLGVFLGLIALIIVGIVGVFAFSGSNAGPASTVADDIKAMATNTVMDATNVKGQIEDTIEQHKDTISNVTGLSAAQVDEAVAGLAISEWQAASLPPEATATGTIDGAPLGIDGSLTTYDDPSYISVEAYGQSITLRVPEGAQGYLPALTNSQQ